MCINNGIKSEMLNFRELIRRSVKKKKKKNEFDRENLNKKTKIMAIIPLSHSICK